MSQPMHEPLQTALHIFARQITAQGGGEETPEAATTTVPLAGQPGYCVADNEYDGRLGLRISAVFVILATSIIGTTFPILTRRITARSKVVNWIFFGAKYFGSGVIIATAFIHLLAPANEALLNSCLIGPITSYSWPEGIALMSSFLLFFIELLTTRYASFGKGQRRNSQYNEDHEDNHQDRGTVESLGQATSSKKRGDSNGDDEKSGAGFGAEESQTDQSSLPSDYSAKLTALFILEFGVVFHSIFIGLTLAVSGSEFTTLYVVIVFHQMFEGLGLGTRVASIDWPKNRRWTPYVFAIGYAATTPIATAIGIGVRRSYAPGTQTALIVNGVFDSISAGILLYTGFVELVAREFMIGSSMANARTGEVFSAFAMVVLGAGLMALLGAWA